MHDIISKSMAYIPDALQLWVKDRHLDSLMSCSRDILRALQAFIFSFTLLLTQLETDEGTDHKAEEKVNKANKRQFRVIP